MPSQPGSLILLTHEFAPFRGGAATYVQEIAAAAVAQGYPVEVWTADYRGRGAGLAVAMAGAAGATDALNAKFHVERLPTNGRLTPTGLLGLMRGLRAFAPGGRRRGSSVVLLSVGALMAWMPLWALGLLPARGVTCFFHGSELLRFARGMPWRRLAKRFFARVDGFAVASRYVADLARSSGLLPAGARICLAPCACPTALLAGREGVGEHGDDGETRADNDDGAWRVLTVARLHPRKGQAELAASLGLLPAALRERIIYQMAGTGTPDYRRQIEAACSAAKVRHEFLGNVPDERLGPIYARCTLYAQASRTLARSVEGFGISFLEASWYGKPVAAYLSGGIAEAVIDGETGLLVPEGDSVALAAAIGKLLAEPALRECLGEGGRRHVAGFDWRRSARDLYDFASGA